MTDPFKNLAEQSHFNIYLSDLWNGSGKRFAEAIVEECATCCGSQADRKNIRRRFGLPVESSIQYTSPEPTGHQTKYSRTPNLPETI